MKTYPQCLGDWNPDKFKCTHDCYWHCKCRLETERLTPGLTVHAYPRLGGYWVKKAGKARRFYNDTG